MDYYNYKASNFEDLMTKLSKDFVKKGLVKKTFKDAIISREREYPTGLQLLDGATVAIPHTDAEHVNKDTVIQVKISKPIEMTKMATVNDKIMTDNFFILLVKDKQGHAAKLADVISLFQKTEFLRLLRCDSNECFLQINNIITKNL